MLINRSFIGGPDGIPGDLTEVYQASAGKADPLSLAPPLRPPNTYILTLLVQISYLVIVKDYINLKL